MGTTLHSEHKHYAFFLRAVSDITISKQDWSCIGAENDIKVAYSTFVDRH